MRGSHGRGLGTHEVKEIRPAEFEERGFEFERFGFGERPLGLILLIQQVGRVFQVHSERGVMVDGGFLVAWFSAHAVGLVEHGEHARWRVAQKAIPIVVHLIISHACPHGVYLLIL